MQESSFTQFYSFLQEQDRFRDDVWEGLAARPKALAPKYFYDERGSRLFDKICETEEYYPTRAESSILSQYASDIMEMLPNRITLIELGSGSSVKTRYLLEDNPQIAAYIPIDISEEHLLRSTARLSARYPSIPMMPVCADYTYLESLPAMEATEDATPLVFFPGSTIGNLDRAAAIHLFDTIFNLVRGEGYLLIGFDLLKDKSILEAAYNDKAGYTAAFNLNLLRRINRELGGDFDLGAFEHRAIFNAARERIEMHLFSKKDQMVTIDGRRFHFAEGESLHTESSHKYSIEGFDIFAQQVGFQAIQTWTDERSRFAVMLLKAFDRRDLKC